MAENLKLSTIQTYVGDMYSMESHIEEALDRQLKANAGHPKAAAATQRFHNMVKSQRDAMKAHLASIGGETGGAFKSAVASLFGVAAGVIDKVRPETVSKNLRDDYTAFNHAAVGYHMLYGTALMLGDQKTAALAEKHHRAYTDAIQDINQIILDVVAKELRDDGLQLDEGAMDRATQTMNKDWKETAPSSGAGSSSGSGATSGSSSGRSMGGSLGTTGTGTTTGTARTGTGTSTTGTTGPGGATGTTGGSGTTGI